MNNIIPLRKRQLETIVWKMQKYLTKNDITMFELYQEHFVKLYDMITNKEESFVADMKNKYNDLIKQAQNKFVRKY
jgi:hypothetical protein